MTQAPAPSRIRSFIAVDLDPAVRRRLAELQRELVRHDADVRWVRPEGMHITLRFLGNVLPADLEQIHTAVAGALAGVAASRLQVRGIGAFPSLRRPRVLWVGLHDDGTLQRLAEAVGNALQAFAGKVQPEKHGEFRPHATLARFNSMRGWGELRAALEACAGADFGSSELRSVIIYRSSLQRGGSVYNPLWTITLTENRGTA